MPLLFALMTKQKLYAYVDESGQDTRGLIFVVSVVVLGGERDRIEQRLQEIEERTHKGATKWHKSRHEFRDAYIEALAATAELKRAVFISVYRDSLQYDELTALTTARAVLKKATLPYKATIFVDGLSGSALPRLRDLHVHTKKIRGVRKDENSALIRLADAFCGLVRDKHDQTPWAVNAYDSLKNAGIIEEL